MPEAPPMICGTHLEPYPKVGNLAFPNEGPLNSQIQLGTARSPVIAESDDSERSCTVFGW
jgi:hypothetical protein